MASPNEEARNERPRSKTVNLLSTDEHEGTLPKPEKWNWQVGRNSSANEVMPRCKSAERRCMYCVRVKKAAVSRRVHCPTNGDRRFPVRIRRDV